MLAEFPSDLSRIVLVYDLALPQRIFLELHVLTIKKRVLFLDIYTCKLVDGLCSTCSSLNFSNPFFQIFSLEASLFGWRMK